MSGYRPRERDGSSDLSNWKTYMDKLEVEDIDYKRLEVLVKFLAPNGKIKPARRTKASAIKQNRAAQAIKQARFLALLPYTKSS